MVWMTAARRSTARLLLRRPPRIRQRVHPLPHPLQPGQVLRRPDLDQRQPVPLLRVPQELEVHPRRARRQRLVVPVDLVRPVQVARPADGIAEMVRRRDHALRDREVVHVPVRVFRHGRPRPHQLRGAHVDGLAPRRRGRDRVAAPPVERLGDRRVPGHQVIAQQQVPWRRATRLTDRVLLGHGGAGPEQEDGSCFPVGCSGLDVPPTYALGPAGGTSRDDGTLLASIPSRTSHWTGPMSHTNPDAQRPEEPRASRPARLACAIPFLMGVAIVLLLLVLFYYLLLVW
jgi:hypothetical protein